MTMPFVKLNVIHCLKLLLFQYKLKHSTISYVKFNIMQCLTVVGDYINTIKTTFLFEC